MQRSLGYFIAAIATAIGLFVGAPAEVASPFRSGHNLTSWLGYLDTSVGRSCTLSGVFDSKLHITSFETMTVLNFVKTSSGQVVRYRLTAGAESPGTAPESQSVIVPYEVLDDGELGTAPALGSLGPGLQWSIGGSQLFPSISELRAYGSLVSSVELRLYGATTAARAQVRGMVTSGDELYIRAVYRATGVKTPGRLVTPAGIYGDLVGLKETVLSFKALNSNPQSAAEFSSAGGLAAFFKTTLYFAPGAGLVQSDVGGVVLKLSGCHGG